MSESFDFTSTFFEQTIISQAKTPAPLPSAPLVTFDLNLSNLQDFLNKVSSSVNSNSILIYKIIEELSSKLSVSRGLEVLEVITSSIPIELGGHKSKSNPWSESLLAAQSSISGLCSKVQELGSFKTRADSKMKKIKTAISSKLSNSDFESEKKVIEEKLMEKVPKDTFSKRISGLEDLMKKSEEELKQKIGDLERKLIELEMNTLWKLRDCENILKTRVNEKFVWDAISTFEVKLKKEQEIRESFKFKGLESRFDVLQQDLSRLDTSFQSKFSDSEAAISSLEKQLQAKLDADKYKFLFDLITNQVPETPEILKTLPERLDAQDRQLQDLSLKYTQLPIQGFTRLITEIGLLSSELSKKINTEKVMEMLKNHHIKPHAPEKYPEDYAKFQENSQKSIQRLENKLEKLSKGLNLSLIKKALDSKANEGQTKEEFSSVGQRLLNIERNQIEIAKEIDSINTLIRKLLQSIEETGPKSSLALLSKKSWNFNCLSCGRGDSTYLPTIPHIQGFDGRFYKTDLSSLKPAEETEDYPLSKSPISTSRLPRQSKLTNILGKDLTSSLSSNSISPCKRFRPSSAKNTLNT